jgi:hypothetical protein
MAKLIIPVNDLPAPSMTNSTYEVRYRVTSEDKNRVSAWTPIFTIDPELQYFVDGDISLLYTDVGAVSASWDSVSIMKNVDGTLTEVAKVGEFDIWIRWAGSTGTNPGDWIYQGRIASNSISVTVPPLYTYGVSSTAVPLYFYIEVYRPSKEKMQNSASDFLMYSQSIDITLSTVNMLEIADSNNFALAVVL